MSRVLVTGASGFIGRNCLQPLTAAGHEVHAVARQPLASVPGVTWHSADLLAEAGRASVIEASQSTHLLHLAWYAEPGKYWTSALNFHWLSASLDLLHRFGEAGGRRAVLAGSCAEYADVERPCDELRTPLAPASEYGHCKKALDELAQLWSVRVGVSVATGRMFHLYGPCEYPSRLVPSVVRALLAGQEARCSAGTQRRDFLSVADAADAFVALLNSDVGGPVNIASGEPVTVAEVVREIARQIGCPELLALGARPMANEPAAIVADVGRLRYEVGWTPQRTLVEGLTETIEWWRRNTRRDDQFQQCMTP